MNGGCCAGRRLPEILRSAMDDQAVMRQLRGRLTVAAILRCVVRSRWRSDCEIFYWRLIDFAELAQPGEPLAPIRVTWISA